MKGLKIMVGIFAITLLLSKIGVLAYSTGVYNINNVGVGGADSSVYRTGPRTKINTGNQTLTNITQSTKMKTKLEWYSSAVGDFTPGYTDYIPLTSGVDLVYPSSAVTSFYPSIMLGDYRVAIAQSTWHLTDGTISAVYNPGH